MEDKVELEGNADAVEFCPQEPYCHVMAAASYTLQEAPDSQTSGSSSSVRLGGLYLFSADQQTDRPSPRLALMKLHHLESPGIFDIKWRPQDNENPQLASACADGTLRLYELTEGHEPASLQFVEKSSANVSDSMCVYVDWNSAGNNPQLAVSDSGGFVAVLDLGESEPEPISAWRAHDFEAWTVAFDFWKPQVLYSGGDDCQFCGWDCRDDPRHPVFKNKTHQMGVCSIQSSALREHRLLTGSYDEVVRLWDMRMMRSPLLRAQLGLGGGIWRLKWHHAYEELVLAACMHNGAAIVRVGESEIQVIEHYKEHDSLAYGASWCRGDSQEPSNGGEKMNRHSTQSGRGLPTRRMASLVATCSFYDRAVHLWRPKCSQFQIAAD